MSASDPQHRHPNRRTFLAGSLAAGAAAALAACSSRSTGPGTNLTSQPTSVPPAARAPPVSRPRLHTGRVAGFAVMTAGSWSFPAWRTCPASADRDRGRNSPALR